MNEQWAIEVLEWWILSAKKARAQEYNRDTRVNETYDFVYSSHRLFAQLREREDQTRTVLMRVLDLDELPEIFRKSKIISNAYLVDQGIDKAEYALGRLRTKAETTANLGTLAPSMEAGAFHALIWAAASGRWASGHYSDAVQRSATALSGLVKDRTGRYELGDSDLMAQAFSLSPPQPGKPRLRWPGHDEDLSVKSMRVGILNLTQGAFSAIRNTVTHSTQEISKQEALEQLATLSMLTRWVELCSLLETDRPRDGQSSLDR
jgi:hypothetical protein